ncbi:hypothetical protein PTTG_07329 [Puccinia triticina 1-1 BBBD Race 1]|uniref:Uncharacterized protein n=1 Tax=Puccinia triticina (isolate 1-1 / race 1 (BBBD)) TaxID=630390 RepID=A0A180GD14_PUCT1|nr:hypothetical protein PTTG_07329 [Puccinia triticina 1-1 BBBD Race 1]
MLIVDQEESLPVNTIQLIVDQEKILVIQKYQSLLLVKDKENLKLLAKLEELKEELRHPMTKARLIKNLSPARLHHKTSTHSLTQSSPRPHNQHITMARLVSRTTINKKSRAGELARANQQIVGLKFIAKQANKERRKLEKIKTKLKELN